MSGDGRGVVRGGAAQDDLRAAPRMRQGTTFEGGGGNDVLRGGRGNDILNGGPGSDRMYGGGGADQFYFSGNDLGQHPSVDVVYDLSFAG